MNFAAHLLLKIAVVYATISLLEYLVHRHLMHRPRVAKFFDSKYLYATFREHMAHHGPCYQVFNHEEQPCGLLNLTLRPLTNLIVCAVPAMLIYLVDSTTAILLLAGALVHAMAWSAVHTEMHRPKSTWFSRTRIYKSLLWSHFLHHRHPGTNFNTLFLLWDWLLLTAAKATEADRQEVATNAWRVRGKRFA